MSGPRIGCAMVIGKRDRIMSVAMVIPVIAFDTLLITW